MDLSALIFVALAVAWAVYLVPKALKHHEDDAASRSIDGFSDHLRVLARREPVSATRAALVTTGSTRLTTPAPAPEASATEEPAASTPAPRAPAPVRPGGPTPAQRRRRVFNVLLLAIVLVAALAIGKVVAPVWVLVPIALMAAWLVTCRLMVKRERRSRAADARVRRRRRTLADEVIEAEDADHPRDDTAEIPVVTAALVDEPAADVDPDAWTPVPVPLPTYVDKAPAGRTVRTIDLDSTGVWSSGRNDADSQLAREAEAEASRARAAESDADVRGRATGS